MQPRDAIEYGVIDGVVRNETSIIDAVMSPEQWDKAPPQAKGLLNLHQLSSLLSCCHMYTHTAPTMLGYSAMYVQPCNKLCYRWLL